MSRYNRNAPGWHWTREGTARRQSNRDELLKRYQDWHWGAEAGKLVHVRDAEVPDVVGIGELREIEFTNGTYLEFPADTWIAFDHRHPHERIHIILRPQTRETNRKEMKYADPILPLQEIARATKGTQARYALPALNAHPLGIVSAVVYFTYKKGEQEDRPWEYHHVFGKEHSRGIKPILAADVSGRLWLCGGSYICPEAGITG